MASIHGVVPHEIIIVDDASHDAATHDALERLKNNNPLVQVHKFSHNRGQAAARNQALELARYDIIAPLDADDVMHKVSDGSASYLDRVHEVLTRQPEVAVAYSPYREFGPGAREYLMTPYVPKSQLVTNRLPYFAAYRKEEALGIGGYNTNLRYAEDWDFWIALMNRRFVNGESLEAVRLRDRHIGYRQHDTGENASAAKKRVPRSQTLHATMARSPEIYEHFYPGQSAHNLGKAAAALESSKIMRAYHLAATDPVLLSEAASTFARKHLRKLFSSSSVPPSDPGSHIGNMPAPRV